MAFLKPPKVPAMTPPVSRDDAEAGNEALQKLRRRRGQAANELLGPAGAEAGANPIKTMGA